MSSPRSAIGLCGRNKLVLNEGIMNSLLFINPNSFLNRKEIYHCVKDTVAGAVSVSYVSIDTTESTCF